MANNGPSTDQLLTTDDYFWMDEPQYYTAMRPRRYDEDDAITADLNDDELLALTNSCLEAFDLPRCLPVPPRGLPGVPSGKKADEDVMEIIRLGARYAIAYLAGERRTLWNIHEKIANALWRAELRGREDAEIVLSRQLAAQSAGGRCGSEVGLVYFIRSEAGPIKIGKANNPEARVRELQTSHFAKLDIAATCEGGLRKERQYHERFAAHRLHGEWFAPHSDILAEIERLRGEA